MSGPLHTALPGEPGKGRQCTQLCKEVNGTPALWWAPLMPRQCSRVSGNHRWSPGPGLHPNHVINLLGVLGEVTGPFMFLRKREISWTVFLFSILFSSAVVELELRPSSTPGEYLALRHTPALMR